MGRFLPPAPFREEHGCVRSDTERSGHIRTLGRKLNLERAMDSQFCEDHIIERNVESGSLIAGVFDGHGGHRCSRAASARLVQSLSELMSCAGVPSPETIGECPHVSYVS